MLDLEKSVTSAVVSTPFATISFSTGPSGIAASGKAQLMEGAFLMATQSTWAVRKDRPGAPRRKPGWDFHQIDFVDGGIDLHRRPVIRVDDGAVEEYQPVDVSAPTRAAIVVWFGQVMVGLIPSMGPPVPES